MCVCVRARERERERHTHTHTHTNRKERGSQAKGVRASQNEALSKGLKLLLWLTLGFRKQSENAKTDIAHRNSSLAMHTSQPGLAEGYRAFYTHTYIHAYTHTYVYTYIYTCKRIYMHTYSERTYIHAYIAARSIRICIHTLSERRE